ESDMIMAGRLRGEARRRCVTSDAWGRKVVSDSVDTFVHRPVCESPVPPYQSLIVRYGRRDRIEHGGEIERDLRRRHGTTHFLPFANHSAIDVSCRFARR